MQHVDPQRLTALRRQKELTRQALAAKANVSERQLARLEGKDAGQVRPTTLDRLARALDVDVELITGERPLPVVEEVAESFEIDSQSLRTLRSGKGWSRSQLAATSGVSERQLARLETSGGAVRMTTFKRIVQALGTDKEKLSGASPVTPSPAKPDDVGFRARVSPELQLAYDLVSLHYGPTRREIIELAPLLFTLLAEGSLAWRRGRVREVDELLDRLRELGKPTALYGEAFLEYVQEGNEYERGSISNVDLMGNDVRREEWGDSYGVPFCDYLCKLAEDMGIEGIVDFYPNTTSATVGFETIWGAEPYEVCRDLLGELTGGSKLARRALVHGDVRLSDIPKELLSPESRDARAAWLEGKLSDEGRFVEELQSSFAEQQKLALAQTDGPPPPDVDAESSGEQR